MKNQSAKQRKRQRLLSERKRSRIERDIAEKGYAKCDGEKCVRLFSDPERAMRELAGHHRAHRGMGASYNREGIDDDENIKLLCHRCHRLEHA